MSLSFAALSAASQVGGTIFDPARHELMPDHIVTHALRNRIKMVDEKLADRFFIYRHKQEEVFVLAFWSQKPEEGELGVMQEAYIWKGDIRLDNEDFSDAKFGLMIEPVRKAAKILRDQMLADKNDEMNKRRVLQEANEDRAKHYAQNGKPDLARAIRSGAMPYDATATADSMMG